MEKEKNNVSVKCEKKANAKDAPDTKLQDKYPKKANAKDAPDTKEQDKYPKKCPICGALVKKFFVNFNLKLVMCENVDCPYPFMTDMIFEKLDESLDSGDEVDVYKTGIIKPPTNDIEMKHKHDEKALAKMKEEDEDQIQENIEIIKQLNKELFDTDVDADCIRNKKWINNLYKKERTEGVQVLKQAEIAYVKLDTDEVSNRQLKIRIDSQKFVQIEISNKNDETNTEDSETK